ncbi:hypothetical protein GWI33_001119 [Rhynchophorus ferrugineus]|uniref:Uncharacterized protein n=1 Tax=Rhynchophorus ferrugineus TaxID=354439 RepID=A0A834INM9_RHYFE|nr:hypothetical protein GWI33_001119 [Rhynchophorus ferrugineus]
MEKRLPSVRSPSIPDRRPAAATPQRRRVGHPFQPPTTTTTGGRPVCVLRVRSSKAPKACRQVGRRRHSYCESDCRAIDTVWCFTRENSSLVFNILQSEDAALDGDVPRLLG